MYKTSKATLDVHVVLLWRQASRNGSAPPMPYTATWGGRGTSSANFLFKTCQKYVHHCVLRQLRVNQFTMFVNPLTRSLKECLPDGFLAALHCLMLMDDTVILATSRGRCIEKLNKLVNFCTDSGMVMKTKKTKLMVINGTNADRQCISCHSSVIDQCDKYVYLGGNVYLGWSGDLSITSPLWGQTKTCLQIYIFH